MTMMNSYHWNSEQNPKDTRARQSQIHTHRANDDSIISVYQTRGHGHKGWKWIVTRFVSASSESTIELDWCDAPDDETPYGYPFRLLNEAVQAATLLIREINLCVDRERELHRHLYWRCDCGHDWQHSHSSCKAGLTRCGRCRVVVKDHYPIHPNYELID